MSTRGRLAQPIMIKAAQGKRGAKAALSKAPVPVDELPEPPVWFTQQQKLYFYDMRDKIDRMKLATASDREMLVTLATRLAEIENLSTDIETNGRSYTTVNVGGGEIQRARPEVRMLSDALRHVQTLLHEFGLSPAARSKVSVKGEGNGGEWDNF